jgi:hypothetical protein
VALFDPTTQEVHVEAEEQFKQGWGQLAHSAVFGVAS